MPRAPASYCTAPGCPNRAPSGGKCPDHRPARPGTKVYNQAAWRLLSKQTRTEVGHGVLRRLTHLTQGKAPDADAEGRVRDLVALLLLLVVFVDDAVGDRRRGLGTLGVLEDDRVPTWRADRVGLCWHSEPP